jgi:Na+/H+ antiporter, bacterial form
MAAIFLQCIILILIIMFLVMLAQRLRIAYPIVLVLGGLALSFVPGNTSFTIDPEMIFVVFLPPLLYDAAWNTSWKEFWKYRRVISSFAFLIVILTSLVVAWVSSSIIPGFTMALGFLLGGIVSPPDAVSATSVLKNVKAPKSLAAILEGESLLNDASSLIIFRFALIAVDTGRFVLGEATLSFFIVITMGILTGVAIAILYYAVHRWLPTTSNMDIVLSFTAPYMMYIVAEHFHFSGVLAVVSGGLFLSYRSHLYLSFRSRLQGATVWNTIGFAMNGIVFMLIGLELPVIIKELGPVSLSNAIWYGVIITGVLIVTRILSTLGASLFTRFASRYITTADRNPGWRSPLAFGWAGMRGVVSLAAALSIPFFLSNGMPFPQRNLILFITFVVILLTLVVQGLTLPLVIKALHLQDRNGRLTDEEQERLVRKTLAEQCLHHLQQQYATQLSHNKSLQQLQVRYEQDQLQCDPSFDEEHGEFRAIYYEMLERQRGFLLALNKEPNIDEDVIKKYQGLLDLEEEKLRSRYDGV